MKEQEMQDLSENIKKRPSLKGVQFHITAWISWWEKAVKLKFYNDKEDKIKHSSYSLKPCHCLTTETEEEYHHHVQE